MLGLLAAKTFISKGMVKFALILIVVVGVIGGIAMTANYIKNLRGSVSDLEGKNSRLSDSLAAERKAVEFLSEENSRVSRLLTEREVERVKIQASLRGMVRKISQAEKEDDHVKDWMATSIPDALFDGVLSEGGDGDADNQADASRAANAVRPKP